MAKRINIAIIHNLKPGGASTYMYNIAKKLQIKHDITFFSFQPNEKPKTFKKYRYIKLNKTKNIFEHLYQIIFELDYKSRKLSQEINNQGFDLIIVNNDYLVQSPHILKYLKPHRGIVLYISHEPVREYYEKTSHDHYSIRRRISRLIRYPIKIIDKYNCKKAKNVVTNSYYSQSIFEKVYNKDTYVIHPGLNRITLKKNKLMNRNMYISFGPLSIIKGHHISINLFKRKNIGNLLIAGQSNNDTNYFHKIIGKTNRIVLHEDISNKQKKILLQNNSIYLATQTKEPFGLSNLEIINQRKLIVGINAAGNSEIIDHGISGFLYPEKVFPLAVENISKKKEIYFFTNKNISWSSTGQKILQLYHYLKNEPAY